MTTALVNRLDCKGDEDMNIENVMFLESVRMGLKASV